MSEQTPGCGTNSNAAKRHRDNGTLPLDTVPDALAYARTYWQHGQEPQTQRALTILATALERVEAVLAEPDDTQWWPVETYMDPRDPDEVVEVRVVDVARVLTALAADGAPDHDDHGSRRVDGRHPLTEVEWTRLRHAAGGRVADLGPIAEEFDRILADRFAAEVES